jgi:hypothetical protein
VVPRSDIRVPEKDVRLIKLVAQVDERRVKEQTLERLHAVDPLLSEIMDVKLVVQPRKNMLNIRVKPEYARPFPHSIYVTLMSGMSRSCGMQRWLQYGAPLASQLFCGFD